jgi:hypothetical protein
MAVTDLLAQKKRALKVYNGLLKEGRKTRAEIRRLNRRIRDLQQAMKVQQVRPQPPPMLSGQLPSSPCSPP